MKKLITAIALILAACDNQTQPIGSNEPASTLTSTDVKAGLCVLAYPKDKGTEFRAGFAADAVLPMTGCMYFVASGDMTLYTEDAEVIATESCVSIWELKNYTDVPCVLTTLPQ
jgi:hypothetical protein